MKRYFIITAIMVLSLNSNAQEKGTLKDNRDGKTYKTVKIGKQTWMAENLNFETSKDSWCYEDKKSNCDVYGKLYLWESAKIACPKGWHLPSDDEITQLSDFLGGIDVAGGKMKEAGTAHWNSPNTGANNSSGFTGLPGGNRSFDGTYNGLGGNGGFWSSTESRAKTTWRRGLGYDYADLKRWGVREDFGFGVRCLKD